MTTNFDFLKPIDKNLYEIISDAEKLYRDEYFEQCMAQTRRFGEHVCKKVLGDARTSENTFDEMLATLKDKSNGSEEEKEFIDDLYFLKKCGNKSVHSSSVKKDGVEALECLQRAFEVAINYCVYNKNAKTSILKKHYDIELLATGKKSKGLAEKYSQSKLKMADSTFKNNKKSSSHQKNKSKTKSAVSCKKVKFQKHTTKPIVRENKTSIFVILLGLAFMISCCILLFLFIVKLLG